MDAFWAITLSVIVISMFWKRERIKKDDRGYEKKRIQDKIRQAEEQAVIDKYTPILAGKLTSAEKAEIDKEKRLKKEREQEIERLRKQGYTDELIAVIIPTINNGQ